MAIEYVEGFNAADSRLVSIEWLRKTEAEVGAGTDMEIRRITSGYDQVAQVLHSAARGAEIRLNSRVLTVLWQPGKVIVEVAENGNRQNFEGDCLVVTLPLSVLQEGHVAFTPILMQKQKAIEQLRMGAVVKVVLRFKRAFWTERGARGGFLHVPGADFPTWWPLDDLPILTGWSGGTRAEALSTKSDEQILNAAVVNLAQGLATDELTVRELLVDQFVFNWQRDPMALGAYSYAAVGGEGAARTLAEPVGDTLFFAGEATEEKSTGTVAGAVLSGYRVAREILDRSA
jgi:monoamine oxidase